VSGLDDEQAGSAIERGIIASISRGMLFLLSSRIFDLIGSRQLVALRLRKTCDVTQEQLGTNESSISQSARDTASSSASGLISRAFRLACLMAIPTLLFRLLLAANASARS